MMYILTQAELDELVPKKEIYTRDEALRAAKNALLKAKKFTCIHDKDASTYGGYCDDCPCGFQKVPSKVSDLLCTLSKDYSK